MPSAQAQVTPFAASVADALLYQFKEYARVALESGDFVVDASYDKILQGLQVAAPQAGTFVLDSLLVWRRECLAQLGASPKSDLIAALHSRLVIEALFLEAALRLVSGNPAVVPTASAQELENLAFDWVLHAEKYVEGRTPDLTRLRDRVVLGASQLLGCLAPISLDSITDRFLKELNARIKAEASSPARQELYTLCHGLRFLRVHGDTPAQLRAATNFLERVFPLKHVAPDKKSRLQQAIADMLTSALAPLADLGDAGNFGIGCDPGLRKQWFTTVGLLRAELLKWTTKQAKQLGAGLPAVAVLTCLLEESTLVGCIDALVDLLHKQLKDKKNASMALLCLVRCVGCFLRRLRPRSDPERLTRWVARSVSPAVAALAKGHLVAPEQLELMRQLCTVVAASIPEYGIKGMVLELLDADGSQPWEASMAGVTALLSILAEAPGRLAGREPTLDLPATAAALEAAPAGAMSAPWTPSQEVCDQLLGMVKQGHHPLEAYSVPHLAAPVATALEKLLAQCHNIHGHARLTSTARAVPEAGPRDRVTALTVFVGVLKCTPYVLPDAWAAGGMADDLPGYSIHVEASVRGAAVDALGRCLVALPAVRDSLIGGLATFIARLQEEFVEVIHDTIELLMGSLREWDRLAAVETATSLAAGEAAPTPSVLGEFSSVARVEGAALGLLCSPDLEIRAVALKLLQEARTLHRSLGAKVQGGGAGARFGLPSDGTTPSSASAAFGLPSSRSASMQHGAAPVASVSNIQMDPPPLLTLPHHVRRATSTAAGSSAGGGAAPGGLVDRTGSFTHAALTSQTGSFTHGGLPPAPAHLHHRSAVGSGAPLSPFSQVQTASVTPRSDSGGNGPPSSSAAASFPFHHHRGISSVPSTPASTPGDAFGGGTSSGGMVYVADIIDRLGNAYASAGYWDFGPWSDLWRTWRPIPEETAATFAACMARPRSADDSHGLRWARVVAEVAREAWRLCDRSAWCSHVELSAKLLTLIAVDSSGRQMLPQEGIRGELARAYAFVVAVAPIMDATQAGERGLASRDVVRLLVNSARVGVEYAVLALGAVDPSCLTLVASEVAVLAEDYGGLGGGGTVSGGGGSARGGGSRGGGRGGKKDDARLVHANVLRLLCCNLPPGLLAGAPALRDRIVEFVAETARYVTSTVDIAPETQQLRYCLCAVAREAAVQLAEAAPQTFPPMLRKQLFDKFCLYCEDGQAQGLFRSELRRHIAVAKAQAKGRDPEQLRLLESEMVDAAEMLEHAALTAMAALLTGPLFDADAGSPRGRGIAWLDRMLTGQRDAPPGLPGGAPDAGDAEEGTWGPPKEHTARVGLRNLLRSHPSLAPVYVDRAYSPSPGVATSYFLVLVEVYAAVDLPIEPHVTVSLVLHKVVDAVPAVRDAARALLGILSRRCWNNDMSRRTTSLGLTAAAGADASVGDEATVDGAVVIGSLAESHRAYQQHLSATLAREHAELAHSVVVEVLSRQQERGGAGWEALLCLPPWLEYASFGRGWEGQWGPAVLRVLGAATAQVHSGVRRAFPVQQLWTTVAGNRQNIVPVLDYLLSNGVSDSQAAERGGAATGQRAGGAASPATPAAIAVGKQVALYLSRVVPRQTIDHLMHEAEQQMEEQDRDAAGGMAAGAQGANEFDFVGIKEFHNKASVAPRQRPLPQQQPLAVHAAAAVAAATASSSRPLTPASIALAIKRSTLDLIIKTGAAVVDTVAVAGAAAVGMTSSGLTTPGNMPRGTRVSTDNTPERPRRSMQHDGGDSPPDSAAIAATGLPPPPRTALTRPEVALCLLSEVACERDEELRPHLPALLHIAILHVDSTNPLVRQEACQLLQYLLYSLALKQMEAQHAGRAAGGGGAESSGGGGGANKPGLRTSAADYARVSGVIGYLQSLGGEAMWPWELPTLAQPWVASAGYVAAFVQLVADCFYYDSSLRERWSAEALKWACCAASRHAASRSHQVFCALSPALSSAACTALLAALQKCLQAASAPGLDTAVELLCTLRVLLANTPPHKLVLYPHIFSACVALQCSSVVRVGELATALLVQLLTVLDLSSPVVQTALLSVLPLDRPLSLAYPNPYKPGGAAGNGGGGFACEWLLGKRLLGSCPEVEDAAAAGGPWLALPQMLVKGLFQPETEALVLEGMAAIARQIYTAGGSGRLRPNAMRDATNLVTVATPALALSKGGLEAVLGAPELGLAVSLTAALPWVCVHVGAGELADSVAAFLADMSGACAAMGWHELAGVLGVLSSGPPPAPPGIGAAAWLPDLARALCGALFPAYSRIAVQRLMEAVHRGEERYQSAALAVLTAIFRLPGLDLGPPEWFNDTSHIVSELSDVISSPLGSQVLQVLQAISAYQSGRGKGAGGGNGPPEWRQCMDDLGESNKVCAEALRRVVEACPGSAELAKAASGPTGEKKAGGGGERLLPFLANGSREGSHW